MVAMEQQRRPRRSFPDEYKARVVELCRSGERSIGAVAKDLDLSATAVRRWVVPRQESWAFSGSNRLRSVCRSWRDFKGIG